MGAINYAFHERVLFEEATDNNQWQLLFAKNLTDTKSTLLLWLRYSPGLFLQYLLFNVYFVFWFVIRFAFGLYVLIVE